MITFEEYTQDVKPVRMPTPEEYMAQVKTTETPMPEEQPKVKPIKIPSPQQHIETTSAIKEKSFIEKHPNLYGVFGMAQSVVPYIKYIDPEERENFAKLSTQEQTRALLMETLETELYVGSGGLTKAGSTLMARYLPKTTKALKFITTPVKEWKALANTPAKEVAAKKLFDLKTSIFKKATGSNPTSELVKQWWDDTGLAISQMPSVATKATTQAMPVATEKIVEGQATEITSPVQKVQQAIKKSKGKIREQKQVYSEARSERLPTAMGEWGEVGGEKGYYAGIGKLKGEMPKVEYKGIGSDITQTDIDDLFNMIRDNADLQGYDKLTAARGLGKLLEGKQVPQNVEIKALKQIFPTDFVDDLLKNRSTWIKIKEGIGQLLNIPRSIMSSIDLSAPLRQGVFLAPSHPVRWGQAFAKSFKLFGSEKYFNAVMESITKKRTYQLMQESGLSLTEMGQSMLAREEAFQSQWAEKIPLIGKGVKASARAYVGFLNKLRADVFEDLVLKAEKAGLDPKNNLALTKAIANFINAGSGRGALSKSLENAAVLLNNVFFSPRLMASRLTLLNPVYYVKQDPFVRKEALKSLFALTGVIGTALGFAKESGLQVGTDVRSSDFGKIKIGNTRIDMMGGFQQYIRAAGQMISGKYVSSTTGKIVTLGEGYKPLTRWDILLRQIETKEAPVMSFITAMMKGQSAIGEKVEVKKEIATRFTPMVLQDIYDIAKDDPDLIPLSALGIFGVGLQTYKARTPQPKGIQPIKPLK